MQGLGARYTKRDWKSWGYSKKVSYLLERGVYLHKEAILKLEHEGENGG
jgi:hypothetical protein